MKFGGLKMRKYILNQLRILIICAAIIISVSTIASAANVKIIAGIIPGGGVGLGAAPSPVLVQNGDTINWTIECGPGAVCNVLTDNIEVLILRIGDPPQTPFAGNAQFIQIKPFQI